MKWACPFCGRDDLPRSREHLFRNAWEGKFYTWATLTSERRDSDENLISSVHIPKSPLDRSVNGVCTSCNGGWMNALDTTVESDVVSLADGTHLGVLPFSAAANLAKWIEKTALVRTLFDRDFPVATPRFREAREMTVVSPAFITMAGRCNGLAPYPGGFHEAFANEINDQTYHVVALGIGRFFTMAVFATDHRDERIILEAIGPRVNSALAVADGAMVIFDPDDPGPYVFSSAMTAEQAVLVTTELTWDPPAIN